MVSNIAIVPIDFKPDGTPRDEKLYAAVQVYAEKEFGSKRDFLQYHRSWAVLAVKEDEPEYFEVMGLLGVRNTPDYSLFHVTPLTEDKEGLKLVHDARDAMVERGKAYCSDIGYLRGQQVLVYVSPEAQRYWKGFLSKIKAEPANRFQVTI